MRRLAIADPASLILSVECGPSVLEIAATVPAAAKGKGKG